MISSTALTFAHKHDGIVCQQKKTKEPLLLRRKWKEHFFLNREVDLMSLITRSLLLLIRLCNVSWESRSVCSSESIYLFIIKFALRLNCIITYKVGTASLGRRNNFNFLCGLSSRSGATTQRAPNWVINVCLNKLGQSHGAVKLQTFKNALNIRT